MNKKTALITGGSRGIGLGIATSLKEAGFDLAINGMRDENAVQATLEILSSDGTAVVYCQGNIGDTTDRKKIVDKAISQLGQINVLVNNAGVAPKERNDLLHMSETSYDRVMDINLKGSFFLSQAVARHMVDHKRAHPEFQACIINISSISATIASINRGQYCISKAGMSMMTQLFASRLGQEGIPVYEVRPGIITTDMTAGVQEKYDKLIAEGLCITPRWGTASDVGKSVAALAKMEFPYSTGQVVMVDGGLTIPRL